MHPRFYLHTPAASGPQKNLFCTPSFTKLHPSYHLNFIHSDAAMWQSSTFKIGQPEQATWQQSLH